MSAIAIFKPLLTPLPNDSTGISIVKKLVSTVVDEVDKNGGGRSFMEKLDLPFAPIDEMAEMEVDHFINHTIKDEKVRNVLTSEPMKVLTKCATECATYAGTKAIKDYMERRSAGWTPSESFKDTANITKMNCKNIFEGKPTVKMEIAMYPVSDDDYKKIMKDKFGYYIE